MGQPSVFERKGRSPFWWATVDVGGTRGRITVSTKIPIGTTQGEREFSEARARRWARDQMEAAGTLHARTEECWGHWVPGWISERYANSPITKARVREIWAWLEEWLHLSKLPVPAAVGYVHCAGYVPWRTGHKRRSGKHIARNTALEELRFFSLLMKEAMRREYCAANPCSGIDMSRDPVKEKVPLTDAEVALVRAECAAREGHLPIGEQWMTTSFEIALYTLCRLRSTQVPMERINFAANEITLRVKGRRRGEPRWLTVPIHPDLRPRLEALRAAGAAATCVMPKTATVDWWHLRQKLQIGHTTFHSTRVTGITRLHAAGVPESFAMRLAGHNSPAVHRIYHKPQAADLLEHLQKLRFPREPAAPPQIPDAGPANPEC